MSDTETAEQPVGLALEEFRAGFTDGWNGRPKLHKTGQYARTYDRAVTMRREQK